MNENTITEKIRCGYEFCCHAATGSFYEMRGFDGITRTWGMCDQHATPGVHIKGNRIK